MNKIFFCGDTHGTIDIEKVRNFTRGKKPLVKDSVLIQLGDIGIIWSQKKNEEEEKLLNEWDNFGFKYVLFIPGNHENYERLLSDEFKSVKLEGISKEVKQISEKVFMLENISYYEIFGKTFFTFRGGTSIDKKYRVGGISWWPAEIISSREYDNCRRALRNTPKFDYLLSHVGSNYFSQTVLNGQGCSDIMEQYVNDIFKLSNFKMNICGHYHVDAISRYYKTISLYNVILDEVDISDMLKGNKNENFLEIG